MSLLFLTGKLYNATKQNLSSDSEVNSEDAIKTLMAVLQIVHQFFYILKVEFNFPPLECGLDLVTSSIL